MKLIISKNADITVVYVKKSAEELNGVDGKIIVNGDEDGRLNEISIDPIIEETVNYSTNVYVLKRTLLLTLINDAVSHGYKHFGQDVLARNVHGLRIYGYEHSGYFVAINSLNGYYRESLKFLDKKVRDEIFRSVDVYTKVKDSAPTKYGANSEVKNSLIADGCVIEGTVENSIIFRGVKIGRGAVVKNSIVMQGSFVGENATLNCIITDKSVVVKDKRVLSGCETHPFYISKNNII